MEFATILSSFDSLFKSKKKTSGSFKLSHPFNVLLVSPHPDDECIGGALALRLQKENQVQLFNAAISLGSSRQMPRLKELEEACQFLTIKNFNLSSRVENEEDWKIKETLLEEVILNIRPKLIICPHADDGHATHIKTSQLLTRVLSESEKIKKELKTIFVAWSEFWFPMRNPNLLLEVPLETLMRQIKGLEKHQGEITRNPYHLRLPGWMMDNVRRGCEVLNGHKDEAPAFAFGALYRLEKVQDQEFLPLHFFSPIWDSETDIASQFLEILEL